MNIFRSARGERERLEAHRPQGRRYQDTLPDIWQPRAHHRVVQGRREDRLHLDQAQGCQRKFKNQVSWKNLTGGFKRFEKKYIS